MGTSVRSLLLAVCFIWVATISAPAWGKVNKTTVTTPQIEKPSVPSDRSISKSPGRDSLLRNKQGMPTETEVPNTMQQIENASELTDQSISEFPGKEGLLRNKQGVPTETDRVSGAAPKKRTECEERAPSWSKYIPTIVVVPMAVVLLVLGALAGWCCSCRRSTKGYEPVATVVKEQDRDLDTDYVHVEAKAQNQKRSSDYYYDNRELRPLGRSFKDTQMTSSGSYYDKKVLKSSGKFFNDTQLTSSGSYRDSKAPKSSGRSFKNTQLTQSENDYSVCH